MFRAHTTTVLGDADLATLRRAAAMAHTTGAIGLRLSAGGITIADVLPHDTGHGAPVDRWRAEPGPGARIDPCQFRLAVAKAWEDHAAGRRVGLVGLDGDRPLTVTWTVATPGRLVGLGAVRARCATRTVWAFASLLAPSALTLVLAEVAADSEAAPATSDNGLTAQLVHDELLDATVVHIESDPSGVALPPRLLDEVLRRMVAAVGAAEVVEALSA